MEIKQVAERPLKKLHIDTAWVGGSSRFIKAQNQAVFQFV